MCNQKGSDDTVVIVVQVTVLQKKSDDRALIISKKITFLLPFEMNRFCRGSYQFCDQLNSHVHFFHQCVLRETENSSNFSLRTDLLLYRLPAKVKL